MDDYMDEEDEMDDYSDAYGNDMFSDGTITYLTEEEEEDEEDGHNGDDGDYILLEFRSPLSWIKIRAIFLKFKFMWIKRFDFKFKS